MTIPYKPSFCPHCHSHTLIKKGSRKNLYRRIPLYFCKSCFKYFSTATISRVKYPPHVMMQALTYYNLGHSQSEVAKLLAHRHRTRVPHRTISAWIQKYAPVCTYARFRNQAKQLYAPDDLIQTCLMEYRQVYTFQLHRAKLELLQAHITPRTLARLRTYLESVASDQFPHHFFQDNQNPDSALSQPTPTTNRSSQIQLDTLPFVKTEKQNLANDLATLGLILARTTRQRHPSIQEFMLVNDSTTLACEIPLYLTADELRYYQHYGFHLTLPTDAAPITGHIDLIQIRNGLIHILDYKPEAHKINPISQLITYALALASRTKLPVKLFKCAWFDDKSYFEFFPLHAVYPAKPSR
jgi:transposase-like protein